MKPVLDNKIKIAVVEDDVEILDYIVSLLKTDYNIEVVKTFEEYNTAFNTIPKLVLDVVVVDINLPGQNGIELVKTLKPKIPHVQFIMYTSLFDAETVFLALKAGATGYITKETQPEKLGEAIRDAFKGGAPMSSDVARKIVKSFHEFEKKSNKAQLSKREQEIINMLAQGLRYKEIADKLFLSVETVRTHIRNIYDKLQVNSRTEALNKYF
jgi:DNA-binding NarL/FixJ family response regulator